METVQDRPLVENTDPPHEPAAVRRFPLIALFVLVAAAAILLAMVSLVARAAAARTIGTGDIIFAVIGGSCFTMVLATVISLYREVSLLGIALAALTGLLIGALVGPIMLLPLDDFVTLMEISAGGSFLLILAGLLGRAGSLRRR